MKQPHIRFFNLPKDGDIMEIMLLVYVALLGLVALNEITDH
ncbi:MAG: hypothetical protein P8I38_02825 [Arenicella sp.]|nr:hypothetical protein [Arenicella sp.]